MLRREQSREHCPALLPLPLCSGTLLTVPSCLAGEVLNPLRESPSLSPSQSHHSPCPGMHTSLRSHSDTWLFFCSPGRPSSCISWKDTPWGVNLCSSAGSEPQCVLPSTRKSALSPRCPHKFLSSRVSSRAGALPALPACTEKVCCLLSPVGPPEEEGHSECMWLNYLCRSLL